MATNQYGEQVVSERTTVDGKVVTTKGPLWSGTSTMKGGRPRIIDDKNAVYVMGDGLVRFPRGFEMGSGRQWDEQAREGSASVNRMGGRKLHTMNVTITVAHKDWRRPTTESVRWLQRAAFEGRKIRFAGHGDPFEQRTWWIITDFSASVDQRTPAGHASRTQVSLSLREARELAAVKAKVPKPAPKPTPKPKPKPAKKYRTHKVKKGDTLWDLSRKYLGRPTRWREIFNLNKGTAGKRYAGGVVRAKEKNRIAHPRWIFPGQVFKIPPK